MTLNSTFPGVKTHFDQKSSLSLLCENLCVGQDRMEEQHAAEHEGDWVQLSSLPLGTLQTPQPVGK